MEPNPGGIITGEAIIDREPETESIWRAIEGKSVVLSAERRVGKSSVLRKVEDNPRNGWMPILYWVEGKKHPIEFVEGLYEELLNKGIVNDKFHNLKKLYKKYVGGDQVGSWKLPQIKENWKTLLESIIKDIVDSGNKALLMFDELPIMLSDFISIDELGPQVGKEFLDVLRGLRNKYEASNNIRFIFCGSIGIDLIIKNLKKNHGYNSDPINNMKIISVSSMDEDGALLLCEKLATDENYNFDDKDKVFKYICYKTDRLPFYIQHVFEYMYQRKGEEITQNTINDAIEYLLNDPDDEGFFRHYIDRIKTYYDEDIQELTLLILDKACAKEDYWEENNILNMVKTHKDVTDEKIKEAINLIWSDHYFKRQTKEGKRSYKFNYSILQNWWQVNRG